MSEVLGHEPESTSYSPDALAFAEQLVGQIKGVLAEDAVTTGHRANDQTAKELREMDRAMQAKLTPFGQVYFGYAPKISDYLHDAIMAGYEPSAQQMRARDEENGHDFLWDEVMELHSEHPDMYRTLSDYGYGSSMTAVPVPFVGAYALPEATLTSMLATMFNRGREYRQRGWGFPWMSDEIPKE